MNGSLIKFFLFLTLPVLIAVGLFVIFTNYKSSTNIRIVNNDEYANIDVNSQIENNNVNLATEDIIEQSKDAKNIESDNVAKSAEETKKEETRKEEVKKENSQASGSKIKIIQNLVSWGYAVSSERNIDTIIIHSSYDALGNDPYDLDGLLKEYKIYGVAPHFVINRKGKIYRLVADENIAYHAGASQMPDGRKGVNNFSVGIELMNTKDDKYTEDQYEALSELIDYLKDEHTIKHILGHSQIAPGRKTDPWNFEWEKLY